MAEQVPSIGRVVHVILPGGIHRPADIIDAEDGHRITVLVKVKPDDVMYSGIALGSPLWYLEHAPYDATAKMVGSWHWPEFVPPLGVTGVEARW